MGELLLVRDSRWCVNPPTLVLCAIGLAGYWENHSSMDGLEGGVAAWLRLVALGAVMGVLEACSGMEAVGTCAETGLGKEAAVCSITEEPLLACRWPVPHFT